MQMLGDFAVRHGVPSFHYWEHLVIIASTPGDPDRSGERRWTRTKLITAELHDYMSPKIGRSVGVPLDQFIDETFAGLLSGKDQVVVGSIGPVDLFHQIVNKRRESFEELAALMDAR